MALLNRAHLTSWLARVLVLCAFIFSAVAGRAGETALSSNEKALKVAFLYNFALFTEWPANEDGLHFFCILGADAFGQEIDVLHGKQVHGNTIVVLRKALGDSLKSCQVVFIGAQAMGGLQRVLDEVRSSPVLTVADTDGAARQGVALNMTVDRNRLTFEANLQSVRVAQLKLSSKLLRLATKVYP
jgi:hypothetical protein